MKLYGIEKGSYNALFGCVEMAPAAGEPSVFVIAGGGSGIGLYRQLQQKNIAFAAGILQENDLDYPVARALAARLISVPPYALPDIAVLEEAKKIMKQCGPARFRVERLLRSFQRMPCKTSGFRMSISVTEYTRRGKSLISVTEFIQSSAKA